MTRLIKKKQKSLIFVDFSSQLAQLTKLYVFQQRLSNNDHVGCSAHVEYLIEFKYIF